MSLKKKIIHNTIVSVLARAFSVIVGVVIIGLNTRYLGQSGFGDFSTVLAFLFVFSVLADLGLYSLSIREISRPEADEKKIISNILTIRLVSALVIFVLAIVISLFLPYSQQIKHGIIIASFGYWAMALDQIVISVFQKYLRMDKVALAEFLSRLLQLALVYFFIYRELGFFGMIWAFSLASLINLLLLIIFVRRYVLINLGFDFVLWKKMISQGYPLAIGAVLTMLYFKLDTVLLSLMKSSAEVGIYSLPYRILEVLIFFPSMFTGLVMPVMSKWVTERDRLKGIIQKSFDFLLIVAVPMVVGTLLLSERVIIFLSSDEFIKSADVLKILILGVAIIFISNLFYNIILALEKQRNFIWIFGVGAIINIVSNLIFIPRYSYYATSVNTIITELVVFLLMAIVIRRAIGYLPSVGLIWKSILAAALMGLSIYFLANWPLVLTAIVAIFVYFICLYFLKGISREDLMAVLPPSPTNRDYGSAE